MARRPRPALAALVLAGALVPSPADGAPPEPGWAAAAHAAPLLWRVEKGGRTSHLFGTVHVGLDLDAALHDAGRVALDEAKRVFVEFDATSPSAIVALVYDALARAELPPERSLRSLLRPETWDRLTARYKGRVPPATLDRMEPWFAVLTLPLAAVPARTGAGASRRPAPILDAAIAARAKAHGARVMALDTPLEGIEAFSAIGRKEGAKMLEQLLTADVESQRHEVEGLIGAYVSEDDRHLVKAFGRLWRREPVVAEQILFRRNERWCERLALWLGDGGVFVATGTFHMFGDRGLVELLRRRGYRVERVRGPAPIAQGAGASSTSRSPRPRPQRSVTTGPGAAATGFPSQRNANPPGKRRAGANSSSGAVPRAA